MDIASIRDRLDLERRFLARDGETIEILPEVSRLAGADGSWHCICFSSLTTDTADAAIAAQIEHYCALDAEVEWKVYAHDAPVDLRERLERFGFVAGAAETVLVLDLNDCADWIDEPVGHEVVRVRDMDQLALFRAAAETIFQKDYAFTSNELARALDEGTTQHVAYVAMDGGMPVSIGRLYTHPRSEFGGLYGGGTLASHRGRGFYRAVVAARAVDALAAGARYLIVDALPTSRPILERLGFVRVGETVPCVWKAADRE